MDLLQWEARTAALLAVALCLHKLLQAAQLGIALACAGRLLALAQLAGHQRSGRHARKAPVVEQVGGHLAQRTLAGARASPHPLAVVTGPMPARVVGSQRFLIRGLQHRTWHALGIRQKVRPPGACRC